MILEYMIDYRVIEEIIWNIDVNDLFDCYRGY